MEKHTKYSSEKPEGKIPLGRLVYVWDDNIKIDIRDMGCDDVVWIHLPRDKGQWRTFMNTKMNVRVPQKRKRGIS
jgi:hypothetical protein